MINNKLNWTYEKILNNVKEFKEWFLKLIQLDLKEIDKHFNKVFKGQLKILGVWNDIYKYLVSEKDTIIFIYEIDTNHYLETLLKEIENNINEKNKYLTNKLSENAKKEILITLNKETKININNNHYFLHNIFIAFKNEKYFNYINKEINKDNYFYNYLYINQVFYLVNICYQIHNYKLNPFKTYFINVNENTKKLTNNINISIENQLQKYKVINYMEINNTLTLLMIKKVLETILKTNEKEQEQEKRKGDI